MILFLKKKITKIINFVKIDDNEIMKSLNNKKYKLIK